MDWRRKLIPRKIPREDEGKRVHGEGTRKDFVPASRRVVVSRKWGPNMLGLERDTGC